MRPCDYRIGDWRFCGASGELARAGTRQRLEPKVAAVLECLIEHAGEVVDKETLIGNVWPDTFVTDSAVFRHMSELRRALGDDARHPRYIETVPKRGYRLKAAVTYLGSAPAARRHSLAAADVPAPRSSDRPIVPGSGARRSGNWRRRAAPVAAATLALVALAWVWRPAAQSSVTAPAADTSERRPPGAGPRRPPDAGTRRAATTEPRRAADPVAYETLQFAQLFEDRVDCASYAKALELLRSTLARDEDFGAAYDNVVNVAAASAALGCSPTQPTLAQLEATVQKGRAHGLGAAAYHRALGHLQLWGAWGPRAAGLEFERYRQLETAREHSDIGYAAALAAEGRLAEARVEAQRVLRRDPTHPGTNWAVGLLQYFDGSLDDAAAQLRRTLELHPGFAAAKNLLALTYLRSGNVERALGEVASYDSSATAFGDRFATVPALVYTAAGDHRAAQRVQRDWEHRAEHGWVPPTAMAVLYEALGDPDRAFEWLRKSVDEHDAWCVFLPVDPTFSPLHPDPRFKDVLKRIEPHPDAVSAGARR